MANEDKKAGGGSGNGKPAADASQDAAKAGAETSRAAEAGKGDAQTQSGVASDPPTQVQSGPPSDAERAQQIARLQSDHKSISEEIADREEERRRADAEYEALRAEARVMSDKLSKLIGQPVKRAGSLAELAARARARGEAVVTAFVPKGFQHRLDDHTLIDVPAGAQPVPASLADHWWFRVNGAVAINRS